MRLLPYIFLFILATSCQEKSKDFKRITYYEYDADTLQTYVHPFDEMITRMEDTKRDDWQKPYYIIDHFGDLKGKTIYDLGSGTGYFTMKMIDRGTKVIAADPDPRFLDYLMNKRDSLKISKKQLAGRLIPYDNPKLEKGEIDGLLVVNTYHMIDNRVDYLNQIRAGLKENGEIVIVNFLQKETPNGPPLKFRVSSIKETLNELETANFKVIKIDSTSLPENYLVMAKK